MSTRRADEPAAFCRCYPPNAKHTAEGAIQPLFRPTLLNLIIIGEAATKLLKDYASFLDRYPDVPWRGMKGMRNRIAHGYFDINLDVVWETALTALPRLLLSLPAIRTAAESVPGT